MKRILLAIIPIIFLMGCSSTEAGSEFSSADINFAEMMIPHHEQALLMSEIALSNSQSAEIQDLATQIRDAQDPEIEQMKSWPAVNPTLHAGHTMDGMLTESELDQLRRATGPEFDRLFLVGMIKHHQGAIDMAKPVIESMNSEVQQLAREIIRAQEAEIALMRELLDQRS
jgi:uncharacterized protein (DUF305 family)